MKIFHLTPEQIRVMAPLIPTSEASLRQIVKAHRGVSAQRAIEIERAAEMMGLKITRESLNDGCRGCEFAKACRKGSK
jgi:DNA-binding transcriptional regulator YdaS (Cro superfamily)